MLGPNGAGKSTLLRIVATLLRPTAGSIALYGHELPREAWKLRGRIGFLGHQPLLYRDLGARENLDFHGKLFGLDGAGAERADELLANLDPAGAEVVAPLLGPAPGRTRVIVTHDVEAALEQADRVLGLHRDGSVAFEIAAAEVDPATAREIYSERAGAIR